MKILIVDDDPLARRLLRIYLEQWGHDVGQAGNGIEALAQLDEQPFSVVVTDLIMPELDGLELIRRMRAHSEREYVYLIALTAGCSRWDVIAAMEAGADDFLRKPLDQDELRVRLRAAQRIVELQESLRRRNRQLELANAEVRAANERMRRDLEAAAEIQEALLPTNLNSLPGVNVAWAFKPCDELAGDILNVIPLDDHNMALYLLDVCGHGVPAALLSVTLSRVLSPASDAASLITEASDNSVRRIVPPRQVADALNDRFPWDPLTGQFFTLNYGVFDRRRNEIRFVSAGHPGPVYVPRHGVPRIFHADGLPIGLSDVGTLTYDEYSLALEPGDRLYLYSDGITETLNSQSELYGDSRLVDELLRYRDESLEDSIAGVMESIDNWRGGQSLSDDVSMLAVEVA